MNSVETLFESFIFDYVNFFFPVNFYEADDIFKNTGSLVEI